MKNISNSLNTRKRRKLERWIRRSNSTLRSKSLSPLPKVFSSMTELSNERTPSLSPSKFSSPSTNLLSESSPIKKKKKERKSQNNQSIVKKSSKNDSKKLTNLNFNEFSGITVTTPKTFRDYYILQMTETFENDLDKLREEEEFDGKKISLLIDCLGSGASSFSVVEQEIFVESLKFRKKKNYSSHSTKVSNSSVSKQEEEEANGSEEVEVDENSKEEMEME